MRKFLTLLVASGSLAATPALAQEQPQNPAAVTGNPVARARTAVAPPCRVVSSSRQFVRATCSTRAAADALYAQFRTLRSSAYPTFSPNCSFDPQNLERVLDCTVQIGNE